MGKVIILGTIANYDVVIGNLMHRYNIPFKIYRQTHIDLSQVEHAGKVQQSDFIIGHRDTLLKSIDKDDVIINCTNSVFSTLGIKWSLHYLFIRRVKTIIWPTGSDITELSITNTLQGFFYRLFWKFAIFRLVPPYPYAIKNMQKLGASSNTLVVNYPHFLNAKQPESTQNKEEIIFFHPSNLDFAVTDNKPNRNSTKGNDRFIRAFIRAHKQNNKLKCIILDRGPDKEVAKEIISQCPEAFIIKQEMTASELKKFFKSVDCVVDQFDVGGFGLIAMEAMSQGKPVMIYLDKNCTIQVYDHEPPVINCKTEDEIYDAIIRWADVHRLQELGKVSELWVREHHDINVADFSKFMNKIHAFVGTKHSEQCI